MTTPVLAPERKSNFVSCLRFLACLLILNSHCRDIYPFYFLALGGGHGNAIFFALSGFCLANIKINFFSWIKRRTSRILPATIAVLVLGLIFNAFAGNVNLNVRTLFFDVINRYWFVWAILIYYVVFYLIIYNGRVKRTLFCLFLYATFYVILYVSLYTPNTFFVELEGFTPIKVYFYFGVMLVGGLLRQMNDKFIHYAQNTKSLILLLAILFFGIVWTGEYAAVFVFNKLYSLQCLIQMSVFLFVVFAMLLACKFEKFIGGGKLYQFIVTPIAECTLEIYLVQVSFKTLVMIYEFPINWMLFIAGSIVMGRVLYTCTKKFPFFLIKETTKRK